MKVNIIYPAIAIFLLVFILKKCEQEPKIVTKTNIETVVIKDTVRKVKIDTVPVLVYVEKVKKDSIVYVDRPTDTSIKANRYTTKLESNNATANLQITTTGELLDVQGTIEHTQTNTVTETVKTVAKSGLFLYGETSLSPVLQRAEIGLDYQIKNTVIIGASTSYNNLSKSLNFNVKLGFRVF